MYVTVVDFYEEMYVEKKATFWFVKVSVFFMIYCYNRKKRFLPFKMKTSCVFFFFLPLTIFNYYIGVVSATLLVAINEIHRSARAKGLSFYQYGMCHYSSKVCGYLKQDLFTSSCFIMETFLSLLPSRFPLFYWSIFSILVTNTFYKLGENLLI